MWNFGKRWYQKKREVTSPTRRRTARPERLESRCLMAANPLHVGLVYLETDYINSGQDLGSDNLPDRFLLSFSGGAADTELTQVTISTDKDRDGLSIGDLIFDTTAGGRGKLGAHPFAIINVSAADPRAKVTGVVDDGGQLLTLHLEHVRAGDTVEFSLDVDEVLRMPADIEAFNSKLDVIASGQEFEDAILTASFAAPHYEPITAGDVFLNDYGDPRSQYGLRLPPDIGGDANSLPNRSAAAIASTVQTPKPISIAGNVYVDDNLNLRRESGEAALAGVRLALSKLNASGEYIDTGFSTTTDANGRYQFGTALGLMPGTYRVVETQPAGYFSVGAIAGSVNGSPVGIATSADVLASIALPLGDLHAGNLDFAEARPASIGGYVYRDDSDDGVRDSAEPGVANVRVRLVPIETIMPQTERTATTAADGSYAFENLAPGRYQIVEIDQPSPFTDGLDSAGLVDGVRTGTAVNPGDRIENISLDGGALGTEYNFGELPLGSIGGFVYLPPPGEDCEGTHDGHDLPLADVLLRLIDSSGKVIAETRTAADGSYRFNDVPKGTYRVEEVTPVGLLDGIAHVGQLGGIAVGQVIADGSISQISLPAGKHGQRYDFCEAAPARLSGHVYHDASNDGRRAATDTGIGGVLVRLLDATDRVVASTTTDAGGRYEFANLVPGSYRIQELTPEGYLDGIDSAGVVAGASVGVAANPGDLISGIVLKQGQAGAEYNFGELVPAQITGRVHSDLDGDCELDADEKPLAGIVLRLLDENGQEIAKTSTDADGRYVFGGLRPGRYTVVQDQPAGFFNGGQMPGSTGGDGSVENRISGITVGSAIVSIDNNFCEHPPSELSGSVYADADADCVRDAGEVGLAGVRIDLLNESGQIIHTTTTDASGSYRFTNLPAGRYSVRETQPAGFLQGGQKAGSRGGDDSQRDIITKIDIGWGERLVEYDFCELEPSSIQGKVFVDSNMDCVHQPDLGERKLAGVTIRLHDAGGAVIATTITDAEGTYRFENLRPGQYSISELQPAGLFQGGQVVGTGGGVIAGEDLISRILIVPGQELAEYNFCELDPSSVQGIVFVDSDGDCIHEPALGERPLAGVTIRLQDAAGNLIATTSTDADGRYRFENLQPGEYQISEAQPAGLFQGGQVVGSGGGVIVGEDLISQIQIGPGKNLVDYNFCELDPSSIEGTVYADSDGDCVFEPALGERPLAGVTIRLQDAAGNLIATTLTDAEGHYRFEKLPPGEYRISEVQPSGMFQGGQVVGSGGGVIAGEDLISRIQIGPGKSLTGYDFCELDPSSIEGTVYADSDGDCVFEPTLGERPLSGVTIRLHDAAGNLVATTLTDAAGRYRFENLPPGEYQISEAQPAGMFQGGQVVGSGGGVIAGEDLISRIQIGPGKSLTGYNFCEIDPSSLAGVVFVDSDDDCVYEPTIGEQPLSGVTVHLHDAGGTLIATTTTDARGAYRFENLRPGQYSVSEEQPTGLYQGGARIGTGGGIIISSDQIAGIPIGAGQNLVHYDFCELRASSLSGRVWADSNLNNALDPTESPIEGVLVELFDSSGDLVARTHSDADGNYHFSNLARGTYTIRETQPSGLLHGGQVAGSGGGNAAIADVISAVPVPPGVDLVRYDFPEDPTAVISGYVYQDGDRIFVSETPPPQSLRKYRDGQRTPDDKPLAGVVVELRDITGAPFRTSGTLPGTYAGDVVRVTTDANGYYEFTGLRGGSYHVYQVQPEGYVDGLDTPGSGGGTAVNAADIEGDPELQFVISTLAASDGTDPRMDAILSIAISPGGHATSNNFSEIIIAPIPQSPPPPLPPPMDPPAPVSQVTEFVKAPPSFLGFTRIEIAPHFIGSPGEGATWHLSIINGGLPRGDGMEHDAMFRAVSTTSTERWSVDDANRGDWRTFDAAGQTTRSSRSLTMGVAEGVPLVGDFNGDGQDEVAIFVHGEWLIDINGNGRWDASDLWAQLGSSLDRPVIGDWDGDGKDDIGIFGPEWARDADAIPDDPGLPDPDNMLRRGRKNTPPNEPEATDGRRFLRHTAHGAMRADVIDHVFRYGRSADVPLAGDWNGDGVDAIAVFRAGQWQLDSDGDGRWTDRDGLIQFGQEGDLPIVGDWNGDGIDDLAVVRGDLWIIDADGDRRLTAADTILKIPRTGDDIPIVGDWDGDGRAEPGLYRADESDPEAPAA